MKQREQEKQQFNARVRGSLRAAVDKLAGECNFTNEELVEVAFAALIGTKDNVIDAKRAMAQMKAKELKLTFEKAGTRRAQQQHLEEAA